MSLLPFTPLSHPCSALPPALPTETFQRGSKRWSRNNRYSLLSGEDWEEGGMAIPLVQLPSTIPQRASVAGPDMTYTRASSTYARSRARRRSGIVSTTGADLDYAAAGSTQRWSRTSDIFDFNNRRTVMGGGMEEQGGNNRPRVQQRKRKRWSNSIGSTTATVFENVRSSVVSTGNGIGNTHRVSVLPSHVERDEAEITGPERRPGKRRRLTRVLKGLAASFRGLGAGGSMA
ncbi:MAG: hypothetical protein Q9216_003657 [Gyalolechia sp. 2 TL-2023]